jgi:NitT/TauT family transport system substrate-binding protein
MTSHFRPMSACRVPTRPPRLRASLCRVLVVLAGATLALPAAQAVESLTLAVGRTPLALPIHVAQARGYFADAGLDVHLDDCASGPDCLARLDRPGAARADVATASEMPVALSGFDGARLAIIATIATSTEDLKLLVHRRFARMPARDLPGRRIGVVPGGAGPYFLDVELMNLGVDPRGASLVELAPGDLGPALRAGRVDAVAAREPAVTEIERDPRADAVALPTSGVYVETFDLVVDRRAAAPRASVLGRLLEALDRAEDDINAQPQDAQALLRERFGLEGTIVDRLWPAIGFRLSLEQSLVATMESEVRWAVREARVHEQQPPNVLMLIEAGPMKAAKPGAVRTGG